MLELTGMYWFSHELITEKNLNSNKFVCYAVLSALEGEQMNAKTNQFFFFSIGIVD